MAIITRWGNSMGGLRIPSHILKAADLRVGDALSCRLLDSGAILLTPHKGKIAVNEEQALAQESPPTPEQW